MSTTTTLRTPTSFRLDASLLSLLKEKTKENHKSLNKYVESILMDVMQYSKPKQSRITPELQSKLDKAREDYQKGNYVTCHTKEELHSLLDSL